MEVEDIIILNLTLLVEKEEESLVGSHHEELVLVDHYISVLQPPNPQEEPTMDVVPAKVQMEVLVSVQMEATGNLVEEPDGTVVETDSPMVETEDLPISEIVN